MVSGILQPKTLISGKLRMKIAVNLRSACRVCGGNKLFRFLEFPDAPLVDDYLTSDKFGSEFLWPLAIYVCQDCHLVQTQHDVDLAAYYKDYHYSVALSPLAQQFMRNLAETLFKLYSLKPGDSVLEVGSGNGFQLQFFKKLGARVFGFEPSESLARVSRVKGIPVAQTLFLPETAKLIPAELLPLKLVLLTYTFDHLSNPVGFLKSIKEVLDPRGLLVIEVHDLAKIIDRREYCLFAHEHPAYYSQGTMRQVLGEAGFDLINTGLLPETQRRANSLLVVARPQRPRGSQKGQQDGVFPQLALLETYVEFARQVEQTQTSFRRFVQSELRNGRRLAGYGAGGRGVMTLAASSINASEISYLCDRNSDLHGYYMPKSHISIVPPDHVLKDWVNEVIVFSFGYMKEIADDLAQYTNRGGKLISLLELL
jgi:SAM-dependent methyltransferase